MNETALNRINLSQKREKDETFEDFKVRRRFNNKMRKEYMKGTLVWNSASIEMKKDKTGISNPVKVLKQGTYIRGKI
jgi:hypothetical protein